MLATAATSPLRVLKLKQQTSDPSLQFTDLLSGKATATAAAGGKGGKGKDVAPTAQQLWRGTHAQATRTALTVWTGAVHSTVLSVLAYPVRLLADQMTLTGKGAGGGVMRACLKVLALCLTLRFTLLQATVRCGALTATWSRRGASAACIRV